MHAPCRDSYPVIAEVAVCARARCCPMEFPLGSGPLETTCTNLWWPFPGQKLLAGEIGTGLSRIQRMPVPHLCPQVPQFPSVRGRAVPGSVARHPVLLPGRPRAAQRTGPRYAPRCPALFVALQGEVKGVQCKSSWSFLPQSSWSLWGRVSWV